MATVDKYKVKVETEGEEKIERLQTAVNGLKNSITSMAKWSGAAFGALVVSAARLADTMTDLGGLAGMSAGKIYQMSLAAEAAGGQFNQVEGMLQRYSMAVEQVREGNEKTTKSFLELGISAGDLDNLNDEQLFTKLVKNLGNMENGAKKTRLSMELLGKKASTLNLKDFYDQINQPVDPDVEKSFQEWADSIGLIETAYRNLQMTVLKALKPAVESVNEYFSDDENVKQLISTLESLGNAILYVGGTFLVLKGINLFANSLRMTIGAFEAVNRSVRLTGKGFEGLGKVFDRFKRGTLGSRGGAGLFKSLAREIAFTAGAFAPLAAAMTVAGVAGFKLGTYIYRELLTNIGKMERYAEAVKNITDQVKELGTVSEVELFKQKQLGEISELEAKIKTINDLIDKSREGFFPATNVDALLKRLADLEEKAKVLREGLGSADIRLNVIVEEEEEKERQKANEERERQRELTQDLIRSLAEEQAAITMTEREQAIYNATKRLGLDITSEEYDQVVKLAGANYDLSKARDADREATEAQSRAAEAAVDNMRRMRERLNETYQDAIATSGAYVKSKREEFESQNRLNTLFGEERFVVEEMMGFERERIGVLENLKVAAQEASAAAQEAINTGDAAAIAEANTVLAQAEANYATATEYYDAQEARMRKSAADQAKIQNSYSQGAKEAWASLGESLTPFNIAQDAISSGFNRMSSAMEEFVETGKLNFKELAASVLVDLGLMISKALLFKAINTAFGGSSILTLPGLADGGHAKAKKPHIVGERGPELFIPDKVDKKNKPEIIGRKGPELFVPEKSGTVIPNDELDSKDLPKRANGGPVDENKPYLIGERGPELFVPKQAGTVIPNNKVDDKEPQVINNTPTTNVNNVINISAIDAKGVAEFFYSNRKTLLGTMNIATKELPYGMAG